MSNLHEIKDKAAVVEQVVRHINHHGGVVGKWFVGIEEKGSDRDSKGDRRRLTFVLRSEDEAKQAMSTLLDLGLLVDDEYGYEPNQLFIYTKK